MVGEIQRPPTIVEISSQHIERAIFSGELRMGEALTEARLIDDMNVSRGTIRQALMLLQDLGLVNIIPHRGAFVASLSSKDVIETYTIRSLIEPYASLIAFHEGALDSTLVGHLIEVLDSMSQAERDNDLEGITRSDVDFHYSLFKAAKHDLLLSIFRNLMSRTRLCMFQNILLSGVPISPNPHEHYEIVHAIKKREPERLVRLLSDHSVKALDHFLNHQEDVDEATVDLQTKFMAQNPWLKVLSGTREHSPVIRKPGDTETEKCVSG